MTGIGMMKVNVDWVRETFGTGRIDADLISRTGRTESRGWGAQRVEKCGKVKARGLGIGTTMYVSPVCGLPNLLASHGESRVLNASFE